MSQSGILALSPPTQSPISNMYTSTNAGALHPDDNHHGQSTAHSMTPPTSNIGGSGNATALTAPPSSGTDIHPHSGITDSPLERLIIAEADSHCVQAFDRLRVQREQARFTDLTLSVQGREFPAHRCVLASCR